MINRINRKIIVDQIVTDDDGNCSGKDKEGGKIEVGNFRLIDITEIDIDAYNKWRSGSGIANSTINRELAIIKRGYNLLKAQRRIDFVPNIKMLREGNVREGFFEKWEIMALLNHSPSYLVPVIKFAWKSGWRKEEILNMTWSMVDLDAEEINLPPPLSKNKRGRKYPLADDDLKKMFRQLWNNRVSVIDSSLHVFLNKKGTDRIKDFRKSWIKTCKDAGIGEKLFHDFRRTCVRNLIREGTPEKVAMQITGHKTRNVFDAYNIVSVEDMKRALKKQEDGLSKQSDKRPQPGDKGIFYKEEGITQIYPARAYSLKVEGDVEETEGRPFRELMNEILEKDENPQVNKIENKTGVLKKDYDFEKYRKKGMSMADVLREIKSKQESEEDEIE